jgi:hypothetical protein
MVIEVAFVNSSSSGGVGVGGVSAKYVYKCTMA